MSHAAIPAKRKAWLEGTQCSDIIPQTTSQFSLSSQVNSPSGRGEGVTDEKARVCLFAEDMYSLHYKLTSWHSILHSREIKYIKNEAFAISDSFAF